jgi:hypothetical protein
VDIRKGQHYTDEVYILQSSFSPARNQQPLCRDALKILGEGRPGSNELDIIWLKRILLATMPMTYTSSM